MPEPPEAPLPGHWIDPKVVRQISQYIRTWQEISAKVDLSLVNTMLRDQASIMRWTAQISEILRPSQEAMSQVIAQVHRVLDQIDWNSVRRFLERVFPPNWGRLSDLPAWEKLPQVAFGDGIPIAWVPRQEVLAQLLSAADRNGRIQLLIEHEAVILADCATCLEECTEPDLADDVTMAKQALHAFQEGHAEVAQSHAVSVANGLITAIVEEYHPGASTYPAARELAQFDLEVGLSEFRWRATLAPVNAFYSRWDGRQGDPVPEALNRFVLGHRPALRHFRNDNALLALMLMSSLLRELQEQLALSADRSDQEPAA